MVGKVISVNSVKGGVGKTTTILNLAGLYCSLNKRVLLVDMDFYSGGIATCLNIKNEKDIFMLFDSLSSNRFTELKKFVTPYNKNIDVLASPKDPRVASKIEANYLSLILDIAKKNYDVVLVDTNHNLDLNNLTILDNSYMSLFIVTNDLVDLKNMRSLVNIFKDNDKNNFLVLLNNSRDTGKDYMSMYDIRNIIDCNIDYTLSRKFYIKNIDKYVIDGDILTLNKKICSLHKEDINNMIKMANDLISDKHKEDK